MDAHFNNDLGERCFSFSREEVLTLKLIDNKEALGRAVLNQRLALTHRNMATLFLIYDLKLKLSWQTPTTRVNWLVTTIFQFVEVIKIQSWSVFTDHSKTFIPHQIWKLFWLVCTLKYKQVTNKNNEVHNPFNFGGPFCEPTFR